MQPSIEVRRVDLWTLFRVGFFMYAALGLIAGLFYALVLLVAGGIGSAIEEDLGFGLLGGALSLIIVPALAVFYGIIGAVFVTVVGALFNLVCKLGGGVRIEATIVGLGPPMGSRPPIPQPPPTSPPPGASPPPSPPPTTG